MIKQEYNQKYYKEHKKELREYSRKKIIEYRKNLDYVTKEKEYYKNWYSKNGRNRAKDYIKKICEWRNSNPEKVKAQQLLQYAVKKNVIQKEHCKVCGNNKTVAHHVDYSRPLNVIWLCQQCHKNVHFGNLKLVSI